MSEEKKKILFLIHTLQVGGAEKVLVNLVNKMDKKKFDVTVMTVINTGAFRSELDKDITYKTIFDIKLLNKKQKSKSKEKSGNLLDNPNLIKKIAVKLYQFFWRNIDCKKIYKKYITEDYDVEVAFLEGISAKIIANSTNKKSKKISWIHVDLLNETKTERFFKNIEEEKNIYQKFNKIVAVSEHVKEQFIKKFNINKDKVLIRYNPIDSEYIIKKALEPIDDVKKENFTLCTVGRLSKQKGYDRLLRIVKKLNEEKLKYELWIIGVGAEEESLREYILKNNLSNVKLLGYKSNPYKYIKASDLFVCSSRAEGFSTVVSEAIVLEKPIIATKCSGMKELLGENEEYGIVCENSTKALYASIKKILEEKNEYDLLKEKIKERKEIFDIDKSIKRIEQLLLN